MSDTDQESFVNPRKIRAQSLSLIFEGTPTRISGSRLHLGELSCLEETPYLCARW